VADLVEQCVLQLAVPAQLSFWSVTSEGAWGWKPKTQQTGRI